jgi:hypothetical protein
VFLVALLAWCMVLQAFQERNTLHGSYDYWNH